ncbi:MAG: glycosyltransferase family 2 protein [Promethearchaeota archaeon]
MKNLSIFIPAFNEEACIRKTLDALSEVSKNKDWEMELIVVDDGSTDKTTEIVAHAIREYPFLRLVRHEHNRGYSEVIKTGLREATADFIVWIDADLQNDPQDIPRLINYLQRDNVGIVIGWRKNRKDSLFRRIVSKIYNRILMRLFFGLNYNDVNGKPKALRRKFTSQVTIASKGWLVDAELVKKAEMIGFTIVEIPVRHTGRQLGKSKLSIKSIFRTQKYILEYFLDQRKQKSEHILKKKA